MTSPGDCVFYRIVAGDEPASIVYTDDDVVAFMDIQPINDGHMLVVPRRHATYAADLDSRSASAVWAVALRVAGALRRSAFRTEGVNFFVADGAAAGQEALHFHMHVIPRFDNDGFGFQFPAGYHARPARSALEEAAMGIREALR